MHLMDNAIPLSHSLAYMAVSGVYAAAGVKRYNKNSHGKLQYKVFCGVLAAFVFTATVFEIPMPVGSTEHPAGTPLAAILLGPLVTAVISIVVLAMELLLKEGSVVTMGANVLSLGIAGGLVSWGVFKGMRRLSKGILLPAFLAGFLGDLAVYFTTATELALGNKGSFIYYFLAFVPGQLPLAIIEGIFTAAVINYFYKRRPEMLNEYRVLE